MVRKRSLSFPSVDVAMGACDTAESRFVLNVTMVTTFHEPTRLQNSSETQRQVASISQLSIFFMGCLINMDEQTLVMSRPCGSPVDLVELSSK